MTIPNRRAQQKPNGREGRSRSERWPETAGASSLAVQLGMCTMAEAASYTTISFLFLRQLSMKSNKGLSWLFQKIQINQSVNTMKWPSGSSQVLPRCVTLRGNREERLLTLPPSHPAACWRSWSACSRQTVTSDPIWWTCLASWWQPGGRSSSGDTAGPRRGTGKAGDKFC